MTPTRLGLMAKRSTPAIEALMSAARWLADRGITSIIDDAAAARIEGEGPWISAARDDMVRQVDAVIVFGGDGTLLEAASAVAAAERDLPLLGVNLGRLGFLTAVGRADMLDAFEALLNGQTSSEARLMLRGEVERDDETIESRLALNDIVVTRGALSRMIEVTVEIDGQAVCQVKADGVIIATATGSTAYNLSAGGPILHPAADALVFTPIAPHTLTNRPLVLSAAATIVLRPVIEPQSDLVVTFDGQYGAPLEPGDVVQVRRASRRVHLVRTTARTHFDMLREKLQWGR